MADGPSGVDPLQMLALIKASEGKGGSGASPLLGAISAGMSRDVDIGSGLKNPGVLKADGTFKARADARPGPFKQLLASMGVNANEISEAFKKIGQAGAVQQASLDSIAGPNVPRGPSSGPEVG